MKITNSIPQQGNTNTVSKKFTNVYYEYDRYVIIPYDQSSVTVAEHTQ